MGKRIDETPQQYYDRLKAEEKEKANLYEEVTSYIKSCKDIEKLKNILLEVIDNNATVNIQEIKDNYIQNFFELFKAGKKIKYRDMPNIYVRSILLNEDESASKWSKLIAIDNNGHKSTHSFCGQVYNHTISSMDLILDTEK